MAELAPELTLEYDVQHEYRLVDDNPWVAYARQQVRDEAVSTLEQRRKDLHEGVEVGYLRVDALSTAHAAVAAEQQYGAASSQYEERFNGLVLDCHRLVGEWYRKNTSEYFSPVRHVFDADKEEFFSHGLSIRQMTENALTPISGNREEESRRINERVEDATPHILRSIGKIAIGTEKIRTTSQCTDKAISDYQSDMSLGHKHRGYDGYVPEIQKVMFRDIWLDTESDDRFEEQIGLPGTYITHDIIQITLESRGARVGAMDKAELHGAQIIAKDDLLDFVAALDKTASEQWCTNVFMGEEVPKDTVKDYNQFKREALARQKSLKDHAVTVALFVLDLAKDSFDRTKAPAVVENFVKKILIGEAKRDSSVAEQIFDKATATGLQEVAYLELQGRYQEAFDRQQEVEKAAPGGGFCGAGRCGLEGVNESSKEGQELAKKLKAAPSDTIIKDTERACRCGKKTIVYAFNKNKVNKYCQSCGSFESKVSKAA